MPAKLQNARANLTGPQGRLYAEPTPSADETSFQQDNISAQYYNSVYYEQHKNQVQPIPPARAGAPPNSIWRISFPPRSSRQSMRRSGLHFHSVGDTGAAKVSGAETAATAIAHEAGVSDAMSRRCAERRIARAGVLLSPGRRGLQLRRGAILLRPVLRAVSRLRPADLRYPRQSRRHGLWAELQRSAGSNACRRS